MSSETTTNNSIQRSLTSFPDQFSDNAWNLLLASEDAARKWKHGNLGGERRKILDINNDSKRTVYVSVSPHTESDEPNAIDGDETDYDSITTPKVSWNGSLSISLLLENIQI